MDIVDGIVDMLHTFQRKYTPKWVFIIHTRIYTSLRKIDGEWRELHGITRSSRSKGCSLSCSSRMLCSPVIIIIMRAIRCADDHDHHDAQQERTIRTRKSSTYTHTWKIIQICARAQERLTHTHIQRTEYSHVHNDSENVVHSTQHLTFSRSS